MRGVTLAGLIVMMGIAIGQSTMAQAEDGPVVPVRILDYTRIPSEAIARAQRLVSDVYRVIGVRTIWRKTIHPTVPSDGPAEATDPKEVFVIILDRVMTGRLGAPAGAVGMAAVTATDGGRVAYVFLDRVLRVARRARSDSMDVMGLVIAHELGHLLLPAGSHSGDGLMRSVWNLNDVGAGRHRLEFTRAQAETIHQALAPEALRPPLD